MPQPLLAVVGPTAVGKTDIAVKLALNLDGEIVSADSRQVYRALDVGTAKPSVAQRFVVPHHLVDVVEPGHPFSVAEYQRRAREAIEQIRERGRLPLLVGGTGLFVQAVIDGYTFSPTRADQNLRDFLQRLAEKRGSLRLWERLASVDPAAAHRVHPHNVRRVIRHLEVFLHTGVTLTQWESQQGVADEKASCMVGLYLERQELYRRIEARVDKMLKQGLVAEVKSLQQLGLGADTNAMQSLGYREILSFLEGASSLPAAVDEMKKNTRRFAKRQLTWFRRDSRIRWFAADTQNREAVVEAICQYAAGRLRGVAKE